MTSFRNNFFWCICNAMHQKKNEKSSLSRVHRKRTHNHDIQASNVTIPHLISRHACSSVILLVKCSVLFVAFPTYFFNASKFMQVEDKAHIKRDNSNYHCCQSSPRFVSFASICFRPPVLRHATRAPVHSDIRACSDSGLKVL